MLQLLKYYLESSSSFWENLSIAIIGALIGVCGSLLIFRATLKADEKEKEKEKMDFFRDKIILLLNLLDSVLENTEKQINNYEEQNLNILKNPYTYHTVKLLASIQIGRLQAINTEDLFKAFLNYFGDVPDTIKSFNKYLARIDFIEMKFKQIMDANKKNTDFIGIQQEQFRNYFNNFYFNFKELCQVNKELESIHKVYINEINDFIGSGPSDLQKLNESILVPLFKNIIDLNLNIKENTKLIELIGNCTATLNHIKINNELYAKEECGTLKEVFSDKLSGLSKLSTDLRSLIETTRTLDKR